MSIIIPVAAVTVIGIICGVMLVVASKFMAVPEDETFLAVRECLPGANCGACGYAGCDGYAHALADGEITNTALCVPGGSEASSNVAVALGVEAAEAVRKVAYIACCGSSENVDHRHEYVGIRSCSAANLLFAGDSLCAYGCLGYGDCMSVCPNGAIHIKDSLAKIDLDLCTGCGLCAKKCPNHLIHIVPENVRFIIDCSNHDKGANTRKSCKAGCIGCKKCERECPSGAITVVDNLAVIDHEKCTNCGHCKEICTTGCISKVFFDRPYPPHKRHA